MEDTGDNTPEVLKNLNQIQLEAVKQTEGPVMVIAGAGSGKTKVLAHRIAYLISKGEEAFNIMALTFTNKAAKEMKNRIGHLVGFNYSRNLWMGTFHSVFLRILRTEHERLAYPQNFTVYDVQDSKNLLKKIIKEDLKLDIDKYKPNLIFSRISMAKNNLISPEDYFNNSDLVAKDRQRQLPLISEIYKAYSKACFKNGAMDFDDLLFKTNILFRDFPDLLYNYQHRFKYILVDEFQDTNFSQYLIVKKISAVHENICVVGDDAQSIYSFRGANIQNILTFEKDFPETKTYKLEQNYRSTKNIVAVANDIISKNKYQLKKKVWTNNDIGEKIDLFQCNSDNSEGIGTGVLIQKYAEENDFKYSDFSILYRTNMQSRAIEESLRKLGIPYKIHGGTSFYQRKEIKDVLAYIKLIINNNDDESFKRIINYPSRKIGKVTINKLESCANDHGYSLLGTVELLADGSIKNEGINNTTLGKLKQFSDFITSYSGLIKMKSAYEFLLDIFINSGIQKILKEEDKTPEGKSRKENVDELLNATREFSEDESKKQETPLLTIEEYIYNISLLTNEDIEDNQSSNKVTLMTIHASKGLEFPYVFVVGLEENLFPSSQSTYSRDDMEEERRLFYVAVTRAEKKLTLSYAQSRYKYGKLMFSEPSRFIEEIHPDYIKDYSDKEFSMNRKKTPFSMDSNRASSTLKTSTFAANNQVRFNKKLTKVTNNKPITDHNLKEGMKVKHNKFGVGVVKSISEERAVVDFKEAGIKSLFLKFARLEIIN